MKCIHCGFETQQSPCPNCGADIQPEAASQNTAAQRILCALKDNLFLVICILTSVSCLLALAADGLPLLDILTTVFLWLTYAQSRKDIADAKHLQCVSGTIYARYVINYVLAGLLLVMGFIFAFAFSFLAEDPDFMDTLLSGFVDMDDSITAFVSMFASLSGGLVAFLFALISALVVVANIFTMRYIHRFAKSVYQSVESGTLELKHVNAVQILLFIISGCCALSALPALTSSELISGLSSGVSCAAALLAGLLIRKHLTSEE